MGLGAKDLVLDTMAYFVDDVYVQWQGCHAIAQLGSTPEYAVQFGQDAIDAVLNCISRADVSELGATGCRSLKNLVQAGTDASYYYGCCCFSAHTSFSLFRWKHGERKEVGGREDFERIAREVFRRP